MSSFGPLDGVRYGLLGLPLAFVALPLYVLLPNHYARAFGVPLATLGAVLLGARLLDAVVDPLLGRLSDRLHARSAQAVLGFGAVAAGVLLLRFGLLFFPQVLVDPARHGALRVVAAVLLALTYAGYSMLSIAHQSWGAMLGGDALQRSRIVGWREGMGLVGVVLASVVPTLAGLPTTVALFGVLLAAGWVFWTQAPRPGRTDVPHVSIDLPLPLRRAPFRLLLAVFVLNGIASAGPASLVPVPVHRERRRARGYNQAQLIARELGRSMRLPALEALDRVRPTTKQHRLDRLARLRNLRAAFSVHPGTAIPPVTILVDDIITTTATLEACAAVLREAGCEAVYGFAIAREV